MQAYLLRRIAQSILTLIGMSVLVFVILRVLPGDPAKMLLPEGAPQSAVDELNRHLGLKEPLYVQYGIFLRSVFRATSASPSSTAPPPSWSSGSGCPRRSSSPSAPWC